jgi:hypothetical protein
MFRERKREEIL